MKRACLVEIYGTVQGVGFRPFVYRLAHEHQLTGWVFNDSEGVKLWVEGENPGPFIDQLQSRQPPAARADASAARGRYPLLSASFMYWSHAP